MKPNEFWTRPDTEPPGLTPGCQQHWLLGSFEEEEKGNGIASSVVKVQGEDPAPPGRLREDRVRKYIGNSQSWVRIPFGSLANKHRDRNNSAMISV